MNKFFIKLILIVLFAEGQITASHAGKIKSSTAYLENIRKETSLLHADISRLKTVLNSNNKTGSFITTDFWGLEPHWYIRGQTEPATNTYPFSDEWNLGEGFYGGANRDLTADAVRNINGVIFFPTRNKTQWHWSTEIDFNFNPGYPDLERFKEGVIQNINKTTPRKKQNEALEYFISKMSPLTEAIVEDVFKPIDNIYDGNGVSGYVSVYRFVAGKLDDDGEISVNDFFTPAKHSKVFTEEVFNKYESYWKIKSRKVLAGTKYKRINNQSLWDYYSHLASVFLDVHEQHFIVAEGMTKSQRFNQLKKLNSMLDKYVSEGKATKNNEGQMTIYEDARSNGRYKGHLSINYKTGEGSWSMPISQAKKDIVIISKDIDKRVKIIDLAIERYLSIVLEETIKTFQGTPAGDNDDQKDTF